MKKTSIVVSIVAVITIISGLLWSLPGEAQSENVPPQRISEIRGPQQIRQQPGVPGRIDEGDGGIRINWQALKLTPEQREKIKQYRRDFQINTAGVRKELQYTEQDLREEMLKDAIDREKIDSLVNTIANLKQQLSEAATQNVLAIKSVLTQEQLELLADQQLRLPVELKGLQLTTEQRGKIRDILKDSLRKNKELADELKELRAGLREMLLASGDVDSSQLKQLQTDIAAKELALEKSRVDGLLQLREALTPEQLKQIQQFRAKRQKSISGKQQ